MRFLGLARMALGILLAAIAGATFHRVFEAGQLVEPIAIGLAAGALVPLALALSDRMQAVTAGLASLAAFVALVGFGLFGNPLAFGDVVSGLIDGWDRILTTTLRAAPEADLLVVPAAVTWLAAFGAVVAALSGASAIGIVTPPLAAFVVGVALGQGGPGSSTPLAIAFVAVAGVLLALAALPQRLGLDRDDVGGMRVAIRDPDRRGLFVVPVALLAALLVGSAVVGPVMPGASADDPTVLRREPPTQELAAPNPITLVSAALRLPEVDADGTPVPGECVLATIERRGGEGFPSHLRVAALDQYDGVNWSTGTTFRTADTFVPPAPENSPSAEARPGQRVRYRVEVNKKPAVFGRDSENCGWPWPEPGFVPTFDRATEVSACEDGGDLELLYDPESGNVATGREVNGLEYCVTSSVPPAPAATGNALIPRTSKYVTVPPPLPTAVEQGPQSVMDLPDETCPDLPTTGAEQLDKLTCFFTDPARFVLVEDTIAHAGHDLGALQEFFNPIKVNPTNAPGGSYEQYAAVFAVAARRLNLPARVVVGFRLGDEVQDERTVELHARDLRAWPEVAFPGQGWVAFEPFPARGNPLEQPAPPPPPQPEESPETPGGAVPERPPTPATAAEDRGGGITTGTVIVAAAAVVAAGAVLAIAVIPFLKSRRFRQRRRVADQRRRAIGAWHEALDRLRDHRVDRLEPMSAAEVARAAEAIGPGTAAAVDPLGELANAALFDPSDIPEESAERAWALVGEMRGGIGRERRPVERLRAALSVRSLRRPRRKRAPVRG
ncbi:MAG: transglutaminase domain-containing protein [Microthrixaceae bacterium]